MTTYRIKPLEWREISETTCVAETIFGDFIVVDYRNDGAVSWYWYVFGSPYHACESLADGKAQAEAFCRQRLLPALEVVE